MSCSDPASRRLLAPAACAAVLAILAVHQTAPAQTSLSQLAADSLLANPRVVIPGRQNDGPGTVPVTNDFVQGVPGDDWEFTAVFETPLVTGERGGFDIFNGVNPADALPGTGRVVNAQGSVNRVSADIPGDRFLLGDERQVYYLGRAAGAGVDNDFMRIIDVEPGSTVRLHGPADRYRTVPVSTEFETGTAIFYNNAGVQDLIGVVVGQGATNPSNFRFEYVTPADLPGPTPAVPGGIAQIGGLGANLIMDVEHTADGGAVVFGMTREDLTGATSTVASGKLFAARYSADGQQQWLSQFGSEAGTLDLALDVAVDGEAAYVTGRYLGQRPQDSKDAFVTKLDLSTGAVARSEVFGGLGTQFGGGVTIDNSEFIYVNGIGREITNPQQADQDPYLEKRRRDDLSLVWRQTYGGDPVTGGTNKEPWGQVAFSPTPGGQPGEGNIYSSGWVIGDFFAPGTTPGASSRDVWLSSFDQSGNLNWVEQWGSSDGQTAWAWSTVVDEDGFIYVGGHTYGDMAGDGSQMGDGDGFISKLDPNAPDGERLMWTVHLGTSKGDDVRRLDVLDGVLYASGYTWGAFDGFENSGLTDIYVARLTLDGDLLGLAQFGTERDERAFVSAGPEGLWLAGFTEGAMTGPNGGYIDGYLFGLNLDLTPVPEPSSSATLLAAAGLLTRRVRRRGVA